MKKNAVYLYRLIAVLLLLASLLLWERHNRNASRMEGELVIKWIEDYRLKNGMLPEKLSLPTEYYWRYLRGGNEYVLRCKYFFLTFDGWCYFTLRGQTVWGLCPCRWY